NDPERFLTYLLAAFQVIDPSIKNLLADTSKLDSDHDISNALTTLINHILQNRQACCLVLDDYHVIQSQSIHQAVGFLLDHRPEPLKIVITTRADPPLPLARLRARSCMIELRLADLRFTLQEAADFLSHTMGLKVSEEDVARLTMRTEGWIAGLQIAALSMQSTEDISSFINSFTGSHHYIFDYLLEEILNKQSLEVQRFLLYTSILDQLSAPLCDSLLEGEESIAAAQPSSVMLETLEHANLFIIPLDQEHCWYRYHPLFAELLRGYLKKKEPDQVAILNERASAWYEAQGLITEAIRHSLAANDWERIIRLISANIFALLEQNELNNVTRQIANLTGETSPARPWLLIGHAWLTAYTGQISSVEPILKQAEGEIDRLGSEQELQTLGGHIAAIRAYANWIADRRDIAAQAAQAALEWLPESERLIRCQAATMLGLTQYSLNDREKSLKLALSYAKECNVSHVTIFTHGCWTWLLFMKGRLREAHAASLEAIQLAASGSLHQPLPTLSHVYTTLSGILREWNDLEGALHYAKEAVDLARHWEQADALHFALDNLGYTLFAMGDVPGAFEVLRQTWKVATQTSTWFERITLSHEIEWYLFQDNLELALQRLRQAHVDITNPAELPVGSYQSSLLHLSIVQIYLAQKEYSKALYLVNRLIDDMEKQKIVYYLVRLLIWQALAYRGLQNDSEALTSLERALTLAATEGYVRSFIQEGNPLIPLLQQARKRGIYSEYIDKLLTASGKEAEHPPIWRSASSQLVEPLSEREMDVLKLLAQGCTDKKIAEQLVIARETVHKHLKNIYGKLDVHSRMEAIVRAQELDLL
ncbi:MAG TPA: LuxR C-terminal-related transcriptional regulator, partial [Anaerolineales bacterium]|nr:LuxR C-terminal-related transcriptional regulator [Anaerolineales bacterium]